MLPRLRRAWVHAEERDDRVASVLLETLEHRQQRGTGEQSDAWYRPHLAQGGLVRQPILQVCNYAIQKCWSYSRQHGTRHLAAMPSNLYGPGGKNPPTHGHVNPAL